MYYIPEGEKEEVLRKIRQQLLKLTLQSRLLQRLPLFFSQSARLFPRLTNQKTNSCLGSVTVFMIQNNESYKNPTEKALDSDKKRYRREGGGVLIHLQGCSLTHRG